MRKYLYIIALVILCSGCNKKRVEMDLDMYNSDQVCLMVKGKRVFTFDEGNGQLGYNRTLKQFRAGNDDMTSFFVLTCKDTPRTQGQELKADLQWTSGNSVKTSGGLTFKVEKYSDTGLVWLWNSADKTGAVVKILN
jgi:hypothetical protein